MKLLKYCQEIYQREFSTKSIFFPAKRVEMCIYWQLSLWVVFVPRTKTIKLMITEMCVLLLTVLIRAGVRRKDRKSVNFMHKPSQIEFPLGSPDLIFLSLAIFCQIELMKHCQTSLMFLIMCEGFSSFIELQLQKLFGISESCTLMQTASLAEAMAHLVVSQGNL